MSICLMDMGSDGLDWVPDSSPARRLDPRRLSTIVPFMSAKWNGFFLFLSRIRFYVELKRETFEA